MTNILQSQKYEIILADPPWHYDMGWGNGQVSYHSMKTEEICNLDVKSIVAPNAHLYLWVTNPFIREGLAVCDAWGFTYKTLITWNKLNRNKQNEMGMGYYFRGCTEHLLFGTKGNLKCLTKTEKNIVDYPEESLIGHVNPKQHSRKPDLFRQKIVKDWSGDRKRLEIFARKEGTFFDDEMFKGWDLIGFGVDGVDVNSAITRIKEELCG